jgi:RHS repeat-associated protein
MQQRCIEIDFPGKIQGMTRLLRRQTVAGPVAWMGSLMQDGQDASGLMFRRNRFYDPAAGRFTQEDPIGLAGGLNTYGFASADPVNYRDPYGLASQGIGCCDRDDTNPRELDDEVNRARIGASWAAGGEPQRLANPATRAARVTADAVQAAGRKSGTAEAYHVNGRTYTGVSGRQPLEPRTQSLYDQVPEQNRSDFHGACGLANCLSRAEGAGESLEGGSVGSAKIRRPENPVHGTVHVPCSSCQWVLDKIGAFFEH